MLNILWVVMIGAGFLTAIFTGNMGALSTGVVDSAKEAIELCITMLGVVGMWNGIMRIAETSGLIEKWTKKMAPIISFLFPNLPSDSPARGYIATNFIANILGLGWAATPAGLKAMDELAKLEVERGNFAVTGGVRAASAEMCTFLIINISSLQLIPVNMIAYRSQYGSANPVAIIGPGLAATLISTLFGVIFVKIMGKRK